MKRGFVIFFLVSYLFSSTEFSELLKIPELIHHFSEHKSANRDISFLHFMAIHYLDAPHKGGDDGKDQELPFKGHTNCQGPGQLINILPTDLITVNPIITIIHKKYPMFEDFYCTSFCSNIWQPPRLA